MILDLIGFDAATQIIAWEQVNNSIILILLVVILIKTKGGI